MDEIDYSGLGGYGMEDGQRYPDSGLGQDFSAPALRMRFALAARHAELQRLAQARSKARTDFNSVYGAARADYDAARTAQPAQAQASAQDPSQSRYEDAPLAVKLLIAAKLREHELSKTSNPAVALGDDGSDDFKARVAQGMIRQKTSQSQNGQ